MKPFEYLEARTVEEACNFLSEYKGKAKAVAGGTDLFLALKSRKLKPEYIVDLKTIADLDYISYSNDGGLKMGALATLTDVRNSPLIRDNFPILATTIQRMAVPAIRNMATVGGNLCNAAPSADIAPPLIALGARIKIAGVNRERTVNLEDFFVGPGETVLQTDEMLVEIQVAALPAHTRCVYLKMVPRTAVDIALVGVAIMITLDAQNINVADARIALGAVAPTPIRARQAEEVIKGKAINEQLIDGVVKAAAKEISPISDVRGSAEYRQDMVRVMTKQALTELTATT